MTMDFSQALTALKAGDKITRKAGTYIRLEADTIYIYLLGMDYDGTQTISNKCPYAFSQEDLLAEDWFVIG